MENYISYKVTLAFHLQFETNGQADLNAIHNFLKYKKKRKYIYSASISDHAGLNLRLEIERLARTFRNISPCRTALSKRSLH